MLAYLEKCRIEFKENYYLIGDTIIYGKLPLQIPNNSWAERIDILAGSYLEVDEDFDLLGYLMAYKKTKSYSQDKRHMGIHRHLTIYADEKIYGKLLIRLWKTIFKTSAAEDIYPLYQSAAYFMFTRDNIFDTNFDFYNLTKKYFVQTLPEFKKLFDKTEAYDVPLEKLVPFLPYPYRLFFYLKGQFIEDFNQVHEQFIIHHIFITLVTSGYYYALTLHDVPDTPLLGKYFHDMSLEEFQKVVSQNRLDTEVSFANVTREFEGSLNDFQKQFRKELAFYAEYRKYMDDMIYGVLEVNGTPVNSRKAPYFLSEDIKDPRKYLAQGPVMTGIDFTYMNKLRGYDNGLLSKIQRAYTQNDTEFFKRLH